MASSSSSAVLELQDADATDTEGASVGDDSHEPTPLIMQHGHDIAVKVDSPMKQLSTLETFVTYRVRCVCARWPTPPHVRRRYNHFKLLHKRLSAAHPLLAAPALPPLHSARQQLDRYSPSFVLVRALALHAFLDRVAKHPIFTHSDDLRLFLTTPDDDLDRVFKSENSALNLWGLSSALYSGGDPKPANGARVKDPEFSSAAEYLQSLQQKLAALCALTSRLYKGSVALGGEYVGMRRACDAWAVQTGGRCGRAAAACGAGAAAAAVPRARAPLAHRATLPLLAAYAAAHLEKIKARDALHAAYVSSSSGSDEIHNRLEQASEALRSELVDWVPKTRAEIKSLLLDLADRQLAIHSQALQGWEHALRLSTDADVNELFKTVSKTAVLNLSPSKRDATPTDTDFDDIEIECEYDSDGPDESNDMPLDGNVNGCIQGVSKLDGVGERDVVDMPLDGNVNGCIQGVSKLDGVGERDVVNMPLDGNRDGNINGDSVQGVSKLDDDGERDVVNGLRQGVDDCAVSDTVVNVVTEFEVHSNVSQSNVSVDSKTESVSKEDS